MPRYVYKCKGCGIVFQVVHSVKERLLECEECGMEDILQRIPSMPLVLKKSLDNQERQVGSLVKEFIEDSKEDLEQEKAEASNQVYKDG